MKKIDVLIKARKLYKHLIPDPIGMCYCLKKVLYNQEESPYPVGCFTNGVLLYNFPEFNPKYFKSTASIPEYWWRVEDTSSRLKAFDTLIELYKNNTEEFIYNPGLIVYLVTFYMLPKKKYTMCAMGYYSALKYTFTYMWRRKKIGVFKIKRLR